MSLQGIYTLANDVVYDQLIALLNSIEVNVSPDIPVCIIPYDDRLEKVKQEVKQRTNVSIFEDNPTIQQWEDFAQQVWAAHPQGKQKKFTKIVNSRTKFQRRYAAFNGPFEQFVVYDADSLAMKPLDKVFDKLRNYDFVFDDWEHNKPDSATALNLSLIEKATDLKPDYVRSQLHCASFFGSKKGLFDSQTLSSLKEQLIQQKEIEWIRTISEAFLFNYLTLRANYSLFNFSLSSDSQDRTGNCADVDPFVNIDNVLYNQQGLKPIHRIHYMNYSSTNFTRLCQGEDVNIRYQDIFLHYRFLKNSEQKPKSLKSPSLLTKTNRIISSIFKKIFLKLATLKPNLGN